jgi:hypothetical protein
MADEDRPLARTEELRQYFAIAGTQLGISAKAHRHRPGPECPCHRAVSDDPARAAAVIGALRP